MMCGSDGFVLMLLCELFVCSVVCEFMCMCVMLKDINVFIELFFDFVDIVVGGCEGFGFFKFVECIGDDVYV